MKAEENPNTHSLAGVWLSPSLPLSLTHSATKQAKLDSPKMRSHMAAQGELITRLGRQEAQGEQVWSKQRANGSQEPAGLGKAWHAGLRPRHEPKRKSGGGTTTTAPQLYL